MIRVILYRVKAKPQVISVSPDAAGNHLPALQQTLGGPVACIPWHDGIQLYCNRSGLLFGLALARRALALSLAEPSRFEIKLHFRNSEQLRTWKNAALVDLDAVAVAVAEPVALPCCVIVAGTCRHDQCSVKGRPTTGRATGHRHR